MKRHVTIFALLLVTLTLTVGLTPMAFAAEDNALMGGTIALQNDNEVVSGQITTPISKATVEKVSAKTYKGKALKPSPKVTYNGKTLKKGTDYTLSYKANNKAGNAKIIIKGKGTYTGTKTIKFKIKKGSLKSASIGKISKKKYTGKAIKPSLTVKIGSKVLKKNVDYTLQYSKNKAVGTAKVTVKGKGNYTGTRTVTFKIYKPKKSETVYITDTGIRYHRGTCKWLYASKYAISKSEAIAEGYTPCKVCKP